MKQPGIFGELGRKQSHLIPLSVVSGLIGFWAPSIATPCYAYTSYLLLKSKGVLSSARATTLWATLLFAGQLLWLPDLMCREMGMSFSGCWVILGAIALYVGTLCGAIHTIVNACALRVTVSGIGVRLLTLGALIYIITHHALFFLPGLSGYPFFSFHHALAPLTVHASSAPPGQWRDLDGVHVLQLRGAAGSRSQRAQSIYLQLHALLQPPNGHGIILTPESFFPYGLDGHSPELKMWQTALPHGVRMILGCSRRLRPESSAASVIPDLAGDPTSSRQSLLFFDKNRITSYYDKKNLVDGFEVPFQYSLINKLQLYFSDYNKDRADMFASGGKGDAVFAYQKEGASRASKKIIPFLCSDILHYDGRKGDIDLVCMNDSWFPQEVRIWLKRAVMWRAALLQRFTWYVQK